MKNITVKIKIFCISFILCLNFVLISELSAIGSAKADNIYESDLGVAQSMSVYDSIVQNQNLLNLTYEHIKQNMDYGLIINTIKNLIDFDNEKYTLFELDPIGYIIYHNDSGKFIEYSSKSPSPYENKEGILYYGGPMEYYQQQESILVGVNVN